MFVAGGIGRACAVRLAAAVSALLFAVYIAAIASAAARGLRIDCGCFSAGGDLGAGQLPTYGREILRDIGQPELVTDNTPVIDHKLGSGGGCGTILGGRADRANATAAAIFILVGVGLLWRRRRA